MYSAVHVIAHAAVHGFEKRDLSYNAGSLPVRSKKQQDAYGLWQAISLSVTHSSLGSNLHGRMCHAREEKAWLREAT